MEKEAPTENAIPEFCISFAHIALQLVKKKTRHNVGSIFQLVSDADFDARNLRWYVKTVDDCNRLLKDRKDQALAAKDRPKKIVNTTSGSSMPRAFLYRKDVLAILRRQMTMDSSQDVFFSSLNVPKHV